MPTTERVKYLDKWFPGHLSWEHHAPGAFAERVFELLEAANPIEVTLQQTGTRYVAIDAMELGGSPTHEEVHLRFRLVTDPSQAPNLESVRWNSLDEPITGSLEPVYYYSLAADMDPAQAFEELQAFVAEHLDDELLPSASRVNRRTWRSRALREWEPLIALSIGSLGLAAVATVAVLQAVQHAIQMAAALAIIELVSAAIAAFGITRSVRTKLARLMKNRYSREQESHLDSDEASSLRRKNVSGLNP